MSPNRWDNVSPMINHLTQIEVGDRSANQRESRDNIYEINFRGYRRTPLRRPELESTYLNYAIALSEFEVAQLIDALLAFIPQKENASEIRRLKEKPDM